MCASDFIPIPKLRKEYGSSGKVVTWLDHSWMIKFGSMLMPRWFATIEIIAWSSVDEKRIYGFTPDFVNKRCIS